MAILFWINKPTILLNKKYILDVIPNKKMEFNEKLNSITRLLILLGIFGYIITKNMLLLVLSVIFILLIVGIFYNKNSSKLSSLINTKENFQNLTKQEIDTYNLVTPTKQNPLMNVMLTDIVDNPRRNRAAPITNKEIHADINNKAREIYEPNLNNDDISKKLFKDLGSSLDLDISMRQFYTMPNSEVANDQQSFAKFCYKDMIEVNPLKKDISFKNMNNNNK
jgi:hypothetical protein